MCGNVVRNDEYTCCMGVRQYNIESLLLAVLFHGEMVRGFHNDERINHCPGGTWCVSSDSSSSKRSTVSSMRVSTALRIERRNCRRPSNELGDTWLQTDGRRSLSLEKFPTTKSDKAELLISSSKSDDRLLEVA
jgi:hypothetical protein